MKGIFNMKKNLKKFVCLALVATCLFATAASAYALTGKVKNGRLNLRKTASTSATIIGYIPNGSTVTIHDDGDKVNNFYHITAPSYLSGQTEKNCVDRTGWGLSSYIN
jgi:uncharacterized protein YgiM (DUF1202 family)